MRNLKIKAKNKKKGRKAKEVFLYSVTKLALPVIAAACWNGKGEGVGMI